MHNPKLADKQGLDHTTREVIDKLHILRDFLEDHARRLMTTNDSEEYEVSVTDLIKSTYDVWFENEQLLQKLWKFREDKDYIKFWTFPACTCPKMDNDDAYPHGRYVTVQNCPIHGWE